MYKIIAVDDEQLALKKFQHQIKDMNNLELLQTFTNPLDSLDFIKENTIDIAFLDIEMPEITGLELAERILEIDPYISIVFITAFDQYALEAFKAHAIGYLLKPLDMDEFKNLIESLTKTRPPRASKAAEKHTEADKGKLIVKCLGQFTCYAASNPTQPISFRTAKTAELFALLIHHYKSSITKYHILDTLFPDIDYDKSNKLFYVSCSYLRNAFAKFDIVDVLLRENDSYRINTEIISCDYIKFMTCAENIPGLNLDQLRSCASMYNGEYLMGRTYEWAFETKPYVDNICQNITFTLVDKLREAGQKDESYQVLDRYIALDPLREESIAKLMEMYVEDGKKDAAVQIYRNFENKLSEELDILPSPRLRAIIR